MPESEIPAWLTAYGPAALPWAVVLSVIGARHARRKLNGWVAVAERLARLEAKADAVNERLPRLETKVDLIMEAMKLTLKD
jgi:hypothetical protein